MKKIISHIILLPAYLGIAAILIGGAPFWIAIIVGGWGNGQIKY